MTLDPLSNSGTADLTTATKVRRWDQQETGDIQLVRGAVRGQAGVWIDLEDGIQVWFEPESTFFRTGDYWLIPARVATGNVEWPLENDGQTPKALPPRGIGHHSAPLAILTWNGTAMTAGDCRCRMRPRSSPVESNEYDGTPCLTS